MTRVARSVVLSAAFLGAVHPAVSSLAGEPTRPSSVAGAPVAQGVVLTYLLDPRGDVEGLLLRDGSQMHITSRASSALINSVHPGDLVQVYGSREPASPLVKADVIVNVSDGTTFTVPYRLDLPILPESRLSMHHMTAGGAVQILLYDYLKGVVHGMLLSDGTQVRLPPDVGESFRRSLKVEQHVQVEGYGKETTYGRALEAVAIGVQGRPVLPLDRASESIDR